MDFAKACERIKKACIFAEKSKDIGIIQVTFHIKAEIYSRIGKHEEV